MVDYADKDRDGVINYDEFVNVITKQYPKIWSLYGIDIFKLIEIRCICSALYKFICRALYKFICRALYSVGIFNLNFIIYS